MFSLSLIAEAEAARKPGGSPFEKPELIYGTVGLAGALLAGAVVVLLVDRWRKRSALGARAEAGTELTGFRAMYERGEITEEEYNRLRRKVADRVKAAPAAGANPAGPAAPHPTGPAITGPLPADYFDDPPSADGPPPKPPTPPA